MKTINYYIYIFLIIIIIILCSLIFIVNNKNKELKLYSEKQSLEILTLKMECNNLKNAIEKQNETIIQYSNDSKIYKEHIDKLNTEIELENNKNVEFEKINKNDITDKEAIEWLKEKSKTLYFY